MWDYFDGLSAGEFWTDFGDVALRAFLSIVVLFILTKLMGNKQISQLNFFDYIIGISIGSIAAEMATTTDRPHHFFVLAMVIYTIITVLITYIARKSIAEIFQRHSRTSHRKRQNHRKKSCQSGL